MCLEPIIAIALAGLGQTAAEPAPAPLRPPPLQAGDTVGLIAPASPVPEEKVARARDWLLERGYAVKVSYGYRDARGYLAGDDATRAAELEGMVADDAVRAIVCLRGGYGSPRLLDRIDYGLLREHPKIIVGYSDITALLNAVHAKTGLVVFHGPMATELGAPGGPTDFTARWLRRALRPGAAELESWGNAPPGGRRPRALAGGSAEGRLVGGNLSVLCATLGTPYAPRTRDAILFLEEVQEKPFRIDRMLNQLRLAGRLAELRGVLLGRFVRCGPEAELDALFRHYFGPLEVPVLRDYPAGHVPDQVPLPLGVRVRLDADAGRITLLEDPVSDGRRGERAGRPVSREHRARSG